MTAKTSRPVFRTDLPPDLEHAAMIREEALDWLENQFPGTHSFSTGDLLQMAGEQGRRWLVSRLRANDIANESEVDLSATADGLTVLFLRSRGGLPAAKPCRQRRGRLCPSLRRKPRPAAR